MEIVIGYTVFNRIRFIINTLLMTKAEVASHV